MRLAISGRSSEPLQRLTGPYKRLDLGFFDSRVNVTNAEVLVLLSLYSLADHVFRQVDPGDINALPSQLARDALLAARNVKDNGIR